MLDNGTKRHIDNARDILVGKIPDPKTQVEQITFALLYKFMDDMDQLSVNMGGKASFFSNGYEQYAWSHLMDKRLSGMERLDLYVRALDQMSQNPFIPPLFRNIFKGAFLPYRDSETLNLFLKEINEFSYTHSENLGDAYEYLLSIFGSQGAAGQFRTPRHIIDFIIECVDPDKNDTILDPACGTAGFLISAYKHILKKYKDTPLTPDEKERLTNNFTGYDISPDMVRLSLMNMYLHQFPNPTIFEYDTLTTDDRWDDNFDVIMANPPFMTPKGGIRPHTRFAVRANRSEVLFVDYIAEHLKPGGRAGVIVPEGIIFQTNNAYKALRKMLVEENYLYAVISLPAGVFKPYSGVKTSILLMDKDFAKQLDSVLFIKVEADGFDLGDQRRPIEANDLPQALDIIKSFKADTPSFTINTKMARLVKKNKLAEGEDYNLSIDRYQDTEVYYGNWPLISLEDIANIYQPKTITSKEITENGPYKVFGANGVIGFYDNYNHEDEEVLITCRGATCGNVNMSEPYSWITGNAMVVSPKDRNVLSKAYLYYILREFNFTTVISGSAQPQITRSNLSKVKIPLPPFDVQQEIVTEIESYQKVIDGARQVVENYKPYIPIDPSWSLINQKNVIETINPSMELQRKHYQDTEVYYGKWPLVRLGTLAEQGKIEFLRGQGISKKDLKGEGKYKCIHYGELYTVYSPIIKDIISMTDYDGKIRSISGDVLVPATTTADAFGIAIACALNENDVVIGGDINIIRTRNEFIYSSYLSYLINFSPIKRILASFAKGTNIIHLSNSDLRRLEIPLPPIEVQQEIVAEIESIQELVCNNKILISRLEEKINHCIRAVWEGT
jgi:type I restriction enzyme M protein